MNVAGADQFIYNKSIDNIQQKQFFRGSGTVIIKSGVAHEAFYSEETMTRYLMIVVVAVVFVAG